MRRTLRMRRTTPPMQPTLQPTPRPTTRCNLTPSVREALAFEEAAGICRQPLFFALRTRGSDFLTMRTSILLAGAALMLAACGKDDQSGQAGNVEQGLTAEAIVANDVTAIDAVTADAANMAADVDINFTNEQMLTDENPASNAQTPA